MILHDIWYDIIRLQEAAALNIPESAVFYFSISSGTTHDVGWALYETLHKLLIGYLNAATLIKKYIIH